MTKGKTLLIQKYPPLQIKWPCVKSELDKYLILIILNRFIWPIDGTLTCTITQGRSGSGSNGNEGVLPRSLQPEP